ncbi:MAG: hypothetical protein QOF82_2812, partial [Frankiales bacterium]|nr:hypothetical protein [Frankiales bacterium]
MSEMSEQQNNPSPKRPRWRTLVVGGLLVSGIV